MPDVAILHVWGTLSSVFTMPFIRNSSAMFGLVSVREIPSDSDSVLKGIYPEFQVIRGLSQKIPADLLSYDKIQS